MCSGVFIIHNFFSPKFSRFRYILASENPLRTMNFTSAYALLYVTERYLPAKLHVQQSKQYQWSADVDVAYASLKS